MCKVHIVCYATAKETPSALWPFFACKQQTKHHIFWWDTLENPSFKQCASHSLAAWCQEHGQRLQEELSTLMQHLAHVYLTEQRQELHSHLEAGDTLSQWYLSLLYEKHPKMLPHLYNACKLRAFECLLETHCPQCTHIVLHVPDPQTHIALQEFCQKTGKQYTYSPIPQKKWSLQSWAKRLWACLADIKLLGKKLFFRLPHFWQAFIRFGHWLYSMRHLRKRCPHTATISTAQAQVSIATYFPHIHKEQAEQGIFRSHYFENLHETLHTFMQEKNVHIQWLFIRINSAQATLSESITLKNTLQSVSLRENTPQSFHYLEEFLHAKDIAQALKRFLTLAWRSRRVENSIAPFFVWPQSAMPLWAHSKDAWRASFQGWRCLERCLQRQASKNYAKHCSQSHHVKHLWSLFVWENCPWERMFTEAMHRALPQSPVYAMQHSCVRPTDFRYFDAPNLFTHAPHTSTAAMLADMYALNGAHAKTLLQKHIPSERLRVVEALRYMYMTQLPVFQKPPPLRHLVLITSYFPDEIEAQMRTLSAWLKHNHYSKIFPVKIHIKAHPHTSVEPYLKKYALNYEKITLHSCTLHTFWQKVQALHEHNQGCMLWLANSTTVTLEAAHMRIPYCVQQAENDFTLCPLHGLTNICYVKNAHEVQKALQEYAYPSPAEDFFALNMGLSGWKALLGIA